MVALRPLLATVEENGVKMTMPKYYGLQIKMMLEECYDQDVRKQLVWVGMKDFPLRFKTCQRFEKANGGRVTCPHLLNTLKQRRPDLGLGCADALAAG